jgi:hypothetical protein
MNPIHDKIFEYLKSKEYWILILQYDQNYLTHIIPVDSKADIGRYLKRYYQQPDLMKYWYSFFSFDPDISSELVASIHYDMQNKDISLYDAIVEEFWKCEDKELEIFHKIIKSNLDAYSDEDLVDQINRCSICYRSDLNLKIVKCSGPINFRL